MADGWRKRSFIWVKDKASKFNRALPGLVKVSNMAGGAAFAADKFYAWAYGVPSGWGTPIGLIDACVSVVGVGGETFIGRFYNIYNPPLDHSTHGPDDPRTIAKRATFWNPGIESSTRARVAYRFLQFQCVLFMANSGMGGFLNQFSLESLIAKIPGLELDSTCTETHSHYAKISIVHLVALYAAYAAILSYNKSNLVRLRQYFVRYVLQGEWRQFGFRSYFIALLNSLAYSRNIAFNNSHTWALLEKNSLCHAHLTPVPEALITGHMYESMMVTMVTTLGSGLPAMHKRNTNQSHVELEDSLQRIPNDRRRLDKFWRICIWITAYNAARGAFVSWAPSQDNQENNVIYYWSMITLAIGFSLFALKHQMSLSYEAYLQQLEHWAAEETLKNSPLLQDSGHERDLPTPEDEVFADTPRAADLSSIIVSNPANPLPTVDALKNDTLLSIAPAATLFGVSNPVQLSRQISANAPDGMVYVELPGSPRHQSQK